MATISAATTSTSSEPPTAESARHAARTTTPPAAALGGARGGGRAVHRETAAQACYSPTVQPSLWPCELCAWLLGTEQVRSWWWWWRRRCDRLVRERGRERYLCWLIISPSAHPTTAAPGSYFINVVLLHAVQHARVVLSSRHVALSRRTRHAHNPARSLRWSPRAHAGAQSRLHPSMSIVIEQSFGTSLSFSLSRCRSSTSRR